MDKMLQEKREKIKVFEDVEKFLDDTESLLKTVVTWAQKLWIEQALTEC